MKLNDFSKIIHNGNEMSKVLHQGKTIWKKGLDFSNVRVYYTANSHGETKFIPLLVPIQDVDSQFDEILDNLGTPVVINGSTINNPRNIETSKGGKVIVCSFNGIPMNWNAYLNGVKETYSARRMDYGIILFGFNNEIKENDLIEIDIFFDF